MPNYTANFNFSLPLVADPIDADLWGGFLNSNWTALDTALDDAGVLPAGGFAAPADSVNTAAIQDSAVTKAKIEDVANMKLLGNVSGSTAAPEEVSILDEDDMASDSATAVPTQQSVKAYVDAVNMVVVDRAYAENSTYTTLTTAMPFDDTLPQNTEGTQILTASIDMKSATNRLRARVNLFGAVAGGSSNMAAAMFVNSGASAVAVTGTAWSTSIMNIGMEYEFVPGSTGTCTVNIRAGAGVGTCYLNGDGARKYGGALKSTLILEEIEA
jgi:hypothetical protein